jgi:hypothetical protein
MGFLLSSDLNRFLKGATVLSDEAIKYGTNYYR